MFLISLVLIGLIAVTMVTDTKSSTTEQAELIPIRVTDGQVKTPLR